ncbi:MAG: hypothetical protein DRQ40_07210, partial [Gammaproteobacteria bacterium]
MALERRAFNALPTNLQTEQNNREFYIADDVLYEPEQADFISGYIGDIERLTDDDLKRTPQLKEDSDLRQQYQLVVGANRIDTQTKDRVSGAFYSDLIRQIAANGGFVDDPNRLFSVNYYAWTPPIDFDKHINFNRYFWMGEGVGDINGEFITKEPAGSHTVIYHYLDGSLDKRQVELVNGLPSTGTDGDLIEDSSTPNRHIYTYRHDIWELVDFKTVAEAPLDLTLLDNNTYYYVARVGAAYNRPLVWKYSEFAGRWLAKMPVVSPITPETPTEGMIWEDSLSAPARIFRIYTNEVWVPIEYITMRGMGG